MPQADGESLFGDGKVSNFVLGSDQIDNDSGQRFTALGLQATFEEDPSQTFFTFNHVGTVQSYSSESLDARNTATINGYAGGLVEPLLPGNVFGQPDNIGIRSNDPDNLDITTDADTNRFNATFKLRDASARNYTLLFGTSTGETGRSAFIDNSRVGAIESALSSAAEQRHCDLSGPCQRLGLQQWRHLPGGGLLRERLELCNQDRRLHDHEFRRRQLCGYGERRQSARFHRCVHRSEPHRSAIGIVL